VSDGPTELTVVIAAVIGVSAVLQTSTGFGFAILSAPLLTAVVGGPMAVTTITITGATVDAVILGGRRTLPRPDWRIVSVLALWSTPGMVLGALALARLPQSGLQLLVAAAVLLAVVYRAHSARRDPGRSPRATRDRRRGWHAPVAGLTSGALGTSTTLAGPPVVMYVTRQIADPLTTRDTLVALSLVRLPLAILVLSRAGTWAPPASGPFVILAAGVVGCVVGQGLHARLDHRSYQRATLGLLAVAAATATIAAVI
jgi:uncharacterized membrane protein YfcA